MRIAVVGASGRMGRCLLKAVILSKQLELNVAVARSNSPLLGKDAGDLVAMESVNIKVIADLATATEQFDLLIDFTQPEVSLQYLQICRQAGKKMVIGTTGYSDAQQAIIRHATKEIAIVLAPNMSVGVNLLFKLLATTANVIGAHSDIEVTEAHHRHKTDAPSGTALRMGQVIADTLGYNLKDCAVYGCKGDSLARDRQTIGFSAIRAGDIVGEHTAMFVAEGERIEITHKASNRMIYANGAMRAAEWLKDKNCGLYDMQDVLGISKFT